MNVGEGYEMEIGRWFAQENHPWDAFKYAVEMGIARHLQGAPNQRKGKMKIPIALIRHIIREAKPSEYNHRAERQDSGAVPQQQWPDPHDITPAPASQEALDALARLGADQ